MAQAVEQDALSPNSILPKNSLYDKNKNCIFFFHCDGIISEVICIYRDGITHHTNTGGQGTDL
jgi:hypothetical protein